LSTKKENHEELRRVSGLFVYLEIFETDEMASYHSNMVIFIIIFHFFFRLFAFLK
jgi:hypothetical protein